MQRNLVLAEGIDSLEDVNLSSVRPVGTVRPPGWPGTASVGHMQGVHQDETTGVDEVAVNSHGLSTAGNVFGRVDLHDGVALRVDRDQTLVPRRTGVDILDGSVSGIIPRPEGPVVKERVA